MLKKAALAQGDDAAREYEHCVHILTEAISIKLITNNTTKDIYRHTNI